MGYRAHRVLRTVVFVNQVTVNNPCTVLETHSIADQIMKVGRIMQVFLIFTVAVVLHVDARRGKKPNVKQLVDKFDQMSEKLEEHEELIAKLNAALTKLEELFPNAVNVITTKLQELNAKQNATLTQLELDFLG